MDVFKIADALVERVKRDYADDISVVAYYGSQAEGETHRLSDLDIFFIPATERGAQASLQFIVDGVGIDFWPISWERANRIAEFQEPLTSVLATAKVLHVRSPKDDDRFVGLLRSIDYRIAGSERDLLRVRSAEAAESVLGHVRSLLMAANATCLTGARVHAAEAIGGVMWYLALQNQTYLTKGPGGAVGQVESLIGAPRDFGALLQAVSNAEEAGTIGIATCQLIRDAGISDSPWGLAGGEAQAVPDSTPELPAERLATLPQDAKGFFEELVSTLNKVRVTAESGDQWACWYAAISAVKEVHWLLWGDATYAPGREGVADLPLLPTRADCAGLLQWVDEYQPALRSFLASAGVKILDFASVAEFVRAAEHL